MGTGGSLSGWRVLALSAAAARMQCLKPAAGLGGTSLHATSALLLVPLLTCHAALLQMVLDFWVGGGDLLGDEEDEEEDESEGDEMEGGWTFGCR